MPTSGNPPVRNADHLIELPAAENLGRLVRSGVAWSAAAVVSRHLLSALGTAVLSRILSPADYGLIAIAAILTTFLQMFVDMGLSWATVQRRVLTKGQVTNLFWTNLTLGAALWGGCICVAPGLAWFYSRSDLVGPTMVLGGGLMLASLAAQPTALLRRRMQFKQLATADVAALVLSVMLGIALALRGYSYWALVWQTVAFQVVNLLAVFAFSGFWPGLFRFGRGSLALFRFGGWLAAAEIPIFFVRNADNILIGKWWGLEALGYYSRAYFLTMLPCMLVQMAANG